MQAQAKQPRPESAEAETALAIVRDASRTAMRFFRHLLEVETKADESPVTLADKTVETEIRQALAAAYPDYAILGEEFGQEGDTNAPCWVVDPIDGTRSFIAGLPLFGMLLGLLRKGVPVLGVVAMPALGETYVGVRGQGAQLNGETISASNCRTLAQANLFINEGEKLSADHPALFATLCRSGANRRLGYDCYPHALLAAGHVDAVVDYDLKPYDYLPVAGVVTAAGGCMSDWQGKPLGLHSDGRVLSAATPELLAELVALVNGQQADA